MATEKFPGPNYNRIIESDPQIIKVPMENAEWGARKPVTGAASKTWADNVMNIKHVSNKS